MKKSIIRIGDIILSKDGKRKFKYVSGTSCIRCAFSRYNPKNRILSGGCERISKVICGTDISCSAKAYYEEITNTLDLWRNLK